MFLISQMPFSNVVLCDLTHTAVRVPHQLSWHVNHLCFT